jgi:hypothetical protein
MDYRSSFAGLLFEQAGVQRSCSEVVVLCVQQRVRLQPSFARLSATVENFWRK